MRFFRPLSLNSRSSGQGNDHGINLAFSLAPLTFTPIRELADHDEAGGIDPVDALVLDSSDARAEAQAQHGEDGEVDFGLDMSISDDGQGVPATAVDRVFFAVHPRLHALSLLRRRLQGLFGRSFRLEVGSELGRGTTVRMRIPLRLRRRFDIAEESLEARQF